MTFVKAVGNADIPADSIKHASVITLARRGLMIFLKGKHTAKYLSTAIASVSNIDMHSDRYAKNISNLQNVTDKCGQTSKRK